MRVGAHQGIGKSARYPIVLTGKNDSRQILEINLMHDTGIRGHYLEVSKGVLTPTKERVTFFVALIFDLGVQVHGVGFAVNVNLDPNGR